MHGLKWMQPWALPGALPCLHACVSPGCATPHAAAQPPASTATACHNHSTAYGTACCVAVQAAHGRHAAAGRGSAAVGAHRVAESRPCWPAPNGAPLLCLLDSSPSCRRAAPCEVWGVWRLRRRALCSSLLAVGCPTAAGGANRALACIDGRTPGMHVPAAEFFSGCADYEPEIIAWCSGCGLHSGLRQLHTHPLR